MKNKKHLPSDPNKVIEYLLSTNADFICIQECFVKKDKAFLTPSDIETIFKSYPYKYIKIDCDHYDYMTGLATFSKYPIITSERIEYESIFNTSIPTFWLAMILLWCLITIWNPIDLLEMI